MQAPRFEVETYKWRGPKALNPERTAVTGFLHVPSGLEGGKYLLDFEGLDAGWSKKTTPIDFFVASGEADPDYEKLSSEGIEFEWTGEGKLKFIVPDDTVGTKVELMILSAREEPLKTWRIESATGEVARDYIDSNLWINTSSTDSTSEFTLNWMESKRGFYLHPKQLLTSRQIRDICKQNLWFTNRINRTPIKLLYFGLDDGCNLRTVLETLNDNQIKVGEIHIVKDFNASSQDDLCSVHEVLNEVYPDDNAKLFQYGFPDGELSETGWIQDDFYDLIVDTYALPWSPAPREDEIRNRIRALRKSNPIVLKPTGHLFPPSLGKDNSQPTKSKEWEEQGYDSQENLDLIEIHELLDDLEEGELIFPKHQRGDVWDQLTKERFVYGLLHAGTDVLGPIVIDLNSSEVVDGKQRLLAILQFVRNEIHIGIGDDYAGEETLFFDELVDEVKHNFLHTQLPVHQIMSTSANALETIRGKEEEDDLTFLREEIDNLHQEKAELGEKLTALVRSSMNYDPGFLILTCPTHFDRVAFEIGSEKERLIKLNKKISRIINTNFGHHLEKSDSSDLARTWLMKRNDDSLDKDEEPTDENLEAQTVVRSSREVILKPNRNAYAKLSTEYKENQNRGKLPSNPATSDELTKLISKFIDDDKKTHLIIEADGKWGKTVLTAHSVTKLLESGQIFGYPDILGQQGHEVSWLLSGESIDSVTPSSKYLTVIDDTQNRIDSDEEQIHEKLQSWDSNSIGGKYILIVSSSEDTSQQQPESNASKLHFNLRSVFDLTRIERIHLGKDIYSEDWELVSKLICKIWRLSDDDQLEVSHLEKIMQWCRNTEGMNTIFDYLEHFVSGDYQYIEQDDRMDTLVDLLVATDPQERTKAKMRKALGMEG